MSSAHDHRKSGKKNSSTKRQPSIDSALIHFLEARDLYQRGRHPIDFRSAKNRLDAKRVA